MASGDSPRVLVVGVGSIGERHLRCFQRTGRVDLAICESNDRLRDAIAGRYGVSTTFASLDDALRDAWDAAVICTPANLHISMASRFVEAGADVLIEKPLSTSVDGVGALRDAVAGSGRVAMVAYVLRVHPVLVAVKRALDEGRFGRPVQLIGYSGQHFPTYRPAYREIYYADRARGGGAIQDALTHLLNAGEWLVGPVRSVAAAAEHCVLEGVEVEDTVQVIARQGRVLAAYSLNQHQAPNESSLTVVCERGTVRAELHRMRWRWQTEPGAEWTDEPVAPLERDDLFVAQAERFLDARQGGVPTCTLDEGLQTLRVNLAILRAAESTQWIELSAD